MSQGTVETTATRAMETMTGREIGRGEIRMTAGIDTGIASMEAGMISRSQEGAIHRTDIGTEIGKETERGARRGIMGKGVAIMRKESRAGATKRAVRITATERSMRSQSSSHRRG
jgi:hypothetical protein